MTTLAATPTASSSKALNVSLWIVQILVGAAFLFAGFFKLTTPIDELAKAMAWAGAMPFGLVRFIGASELLGGLGLILPALTRIQPRLTALAGVGLATVMVLAAIVHVSRGELGAVPTNVILGALATFIAWGRAFKSPIRAR
jgi:putative oxidoreductase